MSYGGASYGTTPYGTLGPAGKPAVVVEGGAFLRRIVGAAALVGRASTSGVGHVGRVLSASSRELEISARAHVRGVRAAPGRVHERTFSGTARVRRVRSAGLRRFLVSRATACGPIGASEAAPCAVALQTRPSTFVARWWVRTSFTVGRFDDGTPPAASTSPAELWMGFGPFLPIPGVPEHFDGVIEGDVFAPFPGTYTFRIAHDDGLVVELNGREIHRRPNYTGSTTPVLVAVQIEHAGLQRIRVSYTQLTTIERYIFIEWEGPGLSRRRVAASVLAIHPCGAPPASLITPAP